MLGGNALWSSATLSLTKSSQSDILSNMKKITARQFQKEFGKIASSMREGQSLEITMRGKPLGQFIKKSRALKFPDFLSILEQESCSPELGDQILKEFNDSLS